MLESHGSEVRATAMRMDTSIIERGGFKIAVIKTDNVLITDTQSALDLIATISWEHEAYRIVLPKSAVCEDFFKLSTGVAGEVLQKFVNYNAKLAIVGDFSGYISKPLRDFIYESNKGNAVFFVDTEDDALGKLSR
jgi:hypothetical protein